MKILLHRIFFKPNMNAYSFLTISIKLENINIFKKKIPILKFSCLSPKSWFVPVTFQNNPQPCLSSSLSLFARSLGVSLSPLSKWQHPHLVFASSPLCPLTLSSHSRSIRSPSRKSRVRRASKRRSCIHMAGLGEEMRVGSVLLCFFFVFCSFNIS